MACEPNGTFKTNSKIIKKSSYVNPFVHKLELDDPVDVFKVYLLTVILLPLRVMLICVFLIIAWLFSCIGLYGLTTEDLKKRPLTGWRQLFKKATALSMRALFTAASLHYIKYKGTQASPKEAPILCVAPHSSYVDSIVAVVLGPPSIVAKAETAKLPFFGRLINYCQPIYVLREDPESRQNTIRDIIERANSKEEWPQVVIFPEGTCTNRSALITFKSGAFYPGVPVQPVLLRYPNKLDTFTWTWEGPGALKLLWLTLTQFHSACEIEFLPVYKPSEEEKANPKLYAKNVRDIMARALAVPVSDFTYDDCKIMTTAKDMKIPYAADIVEIERLRRVLGLCDTNIENKLMGDGNSLTSEVTFEEFAKKLKISSESDALEQLFVILDVEECGKINLRDYLLCSIFLIQQDANMKEFLLSVAKIYGCAKRYISKVELFNILKHTGRISKEKCDSIFTDITSEGREGVTFDDILEFIQQQSSYSPLLGLDELLKKQ